MGALEFALLAPLLLLLFAASVDLVSWYLTWLRLDRTAEELCNIVTQARRSSFLYVSFARSSWRVNLPRGSSSFRANTMTAGRSSVSQMKQCDLPRSAPTATREEYGPGRCPG